MSSSTAHSTGESDDELDALEGQAVMFDVLKGGYGKSALSFNLAERLASRGHDVLYMDLDPNGHITFQLDFEDVFYDETHDYGFATLDRKAYAKGDVEPEELIYETEFGFDFVPSYDDMEVFEATLNQVEQKHRVLGEEFLLPLYNSGQYDYFIFDGGGERSNIADTGFYSGKRAIVPLAPGDEALSAWNRTWKRVIEPLEQTGFELLAVVPNLLSQRIDVQNDDRILIERLNNSDLISQYLPSFAQYSEDEFEAIDNGEPHELPGIRRDATISGGVSDGLPAAEYDEEWDQIDYFDELAEIVENDGTSQ